MPDADPGASVTTRDLATGEVETRHCDDDDYVLVVGPKLYLAHVLSYANGTKILTIKKHQD